LGNDIISNSKVIVQEKGTGNGEEREGETSTLWVAEMVWNPPPFFFFLGALPSGRKKANTVTK
jgi:hypothetical protein